MATRIRIKFAKTEAMRFTGNLDVQRTWERTLRRAGLPLAYSKGYRPHARINLASALPLGITSESELMDIWLEDDMPNEEIKAALDKTLPSGLQILDIDEVTQKEASLQSQVIEAEYLVTFLENLPGLDQRVESLLGEESIKRERRGKTYDLRLLILKIRHIPNDEDGHEQITMHLKAQQGATGRPEEVIEAMGGKAKTARVHRTRLILI